MIKQSTNTILKVEYSQFNSTYAINRGSILLQDYYKSVAIFRNSVFFNNRAGYGGVFYSQFASYIEFHYCTFIRNSANEAGIGYLKSYSLININYSIFKENTAVKTSLFSITDASYNSSLINNSTFISNTRDKS